MTSRTLIKRTLLISEEGIMDDDEKSLSGLLTED